MNIFVLSKEEMINLLNEDNETIFNANIISIRDKGTKQIFKPTRKDVLSLAFDDVLQGEQNNIDMLDARAIKRFANKTALEQKDLIIHCNGGVGRSAAVGAAISAALGDKVQPSSKDFWTIGHYTPNEYVYQMVLCAFAIDIHPDTIIKLVEENLEAYKKKHPDRFF